MSTETAEPTAFNPATDNPSDPAGTLLPPTARQAAKSLSLYISGKPMLSDKTLSRYTQLIRDEIDNQSYSLAEWNGALELGDGNPLGEVILRTLENRISDNDAVLESSKTLETQLKDKFGAEGRGLHEYTSNVESALPENLVKTLRWIATRRNGIVHGDGDGFQDTQERARFVLQAARSWDWLANFESPVNDEQRIAASSLRRREMKWLEKLSKINKEPSPMLVLGVFGIAAIAAPLLLWLMVGGGIIYVGLAWSVMLLSVGSLRALSHARQIEEAKKKKIKKVTT